MKNKIVSFQLFLLLFFVKDLYSADLDGTSSLVYQTDHYVFRNGDSATGLVSLKDGFTIESGTATLDVFLPMAGDIDLNAATLELDGDLAFAADVTTTGGGSISGQGNTIFLGSDWTIPEGVTIEITTDTVINGKGNVITFENGGKLQLDANATLTLKNATLVSKNNSLTNPFIDMASSTAELALDSIIMNLSGDYAFEMGRLFIHNTVRVTGTSAFKYQSSQQSYIAPKSCFVFDQDTSFFYNPGSSSDNLLQLEDETAELQFNGSSLNLSTTGMRISRGRLVIDNGVTFSTQGTSLSQGITLGDSSIGSMGNLNILLMSAATLDIHGNLVNDLVVS